MASEIRANTLKNRVGLGTISFTDSGPVVSGIATANTFRLPDATSGSLGRLQLGNGLHLSLYHNGSNSFLVNNNGYLSIQSQSGVNGIFIARNAEVNLYFGSSVRLQTSSAGVTINKDLDVDGHTNLDNVSIAGVTTHTGAITANGSIDLNADLDVDGHTNLDNVSIAGINTIGSLNNTVYTPHASNWATRSAITLFGNYGGGLAFNDNNNNGFVQYVSGSGVDFWLSNGAVGGSLATSLKATKGGAVQLYHAGTSRISTASYGAAINGDLDIAGSLRHGGDTDTKISFDTNIIHFDTDNTERLRIGSNGYVNIGSGSAEEQLTIRNTTQHCLIRIISKNDSSAGVDFGDPEDTDIGRIRYYHSDGSNTNYMRLDTNGAERLRIDSAGRLSLGVGASPGSYPVGATARQVQAEIKGAIDTGNNKHDGSLAINCTNNNANLHLIRSDNNQSANVGLSNISFSGFDGTDYHVGAQISGIRDAAGGSNDIPARLVFLTTADGAYQPTERLRITSDGKVLVNCTSINAGGADPHFGVESTSSNIGIIQVHAGDGEGVGDLSGISFSHGIENEIARPKAAIALRATGTYGRGDLCFYVDGASDNNAVSSGDEKLRIGSSGEVSLRRGGISATPSLEIYGSGTHSDSEADNLRFHNWGNSSGDYWQIGVNSTLDGNGNNAKPSTTTKGAAIRLNAKNGKVTLITSPSSTSTQKEGLTQDENGIVTIPHQVAFFAHCNIADHDLSIGDKFQFNTIPSSGNVSYNSNHTTFGGTNVFNTSTNTFTAPVAGLYSFTVTAYYRRNNDPLGPLVPRVNNTEVHNGNNGVFFFGPVSTNNGDTLSGTVILQLAANDAVTIHRRNHGTGTVRFYGPHSHFCGHLIG